MRILAILLLGTQATAAVAQDIPIIGKIYKSGDNFTIESPGGLRLQALGAGIVQRHGKYFVKIGSELRQSFEKHDAACPNKGPTFCSGFAEACCGSGQVVRACFGSWGCP
jgi:hypothetical protein